MVLSLLAIVLGLLLVVGLHEAGHALAARAYGVKIRRISIGFGRPLLKWQSKKGYEWIWALWPLGGYVQLLNSRIEAVPVQNYPYCFDKKPIWMRVIILLSGGLANLVAAWIALLIFFMIGYQQTAPVIASVSSSSIAAVAGLQAEDRLFSIAGKETPSWQQAGMQFIMNLGKPDVQVVVENSSGIKRLTTLNLNQWQYTHQHNALLTGIGIIPDLSNDHQEQVPGRSFLEASCQSLMQIIQLLVFFLVVLKQLVSGVLPFAVLLGPIGIFTEMVVSFFEGLAVFLYFIATMSLAVGLINLFPIPGLDGGSIVYALVEGVRGRPISIALEVLFHRLAFIIFCVLMVHLVMNDLQRYVQGS
ncbi:M50 family metallopeptidase [Legionella nagasakiensis]|uniref:M50 family metallopeptidase n=1 Tax=Legionella nagasakiensis TaxID=535290 RepID=UPI001055BC71|nr:site-2 protease family protein [Legionella nagasakiensis]